MKATLIKKPEGFAGDAGLYKLDPPLPTGPFVVVSAAVSMFGGPETYIFPANESGEVTGWGELEGSFRGSLNHIKALNNAGYELAQ